MVKRVENVRTHLEAQGLTSRQLESPPHRQIDIPESGTSQAVSPKVPDLSRSRIAEGTDIQNLLPTADIHRNGQLRQNTFHQVRAVIEKFQPALRRDGTVRSTTC